MRQNRLLAGFVVIFVCSMTFADDVTKNKTATPRPLKALLIAGGCCHDYAHQQAALCKGIQARANVQVDVYWTDNSTTAPILPLYEGLDWAQKYDVIIHDECAADVKDQAIVDRILLTHQTIPAVHLHCAMHSFRTGNHAWFKHLGLQSSGHGPQEPIAINFVDTKHPITSTLSDWTTINEELYNNVKLFGAHPLAVGKQTVTNGPQTKNEEAVVAWTNETQGARSFSTTIGHNTETVEDPRYLELVTRGLLWACGKLSPEYLNPFQGENKVTFIDKELVKPDPAMLLGKVPADATLIKITASSTQSGNETIRAADGDKETRWCADGDSYPQWLQFEFEQPHRLLEIEVAWESGNGVYRYRVEGSADEKEWSLLLDKSKNTSNQQIAEPLTGNTSVKFVRIIGTGSNAGWCSIREVKIKGDGIGTLWPADPQNKSTSFVPVRGNPLSSHGNTVPEIVVLSTEQEAEILKDVKVPDGFDVTVFAAPPAVNYPVFVAAATDGTLYVSSDGNGSLGRSPGRGRVIRLRDLDGDGHADETKIFCKIDAPRGLVWDHDRLYLVHPPHLSEFIDHDGDGVAEEQNVLVSNIAFGYDKRPADHTTNGLSLGVDGWLYIAGGDFGFIDAEGTDGRKVTHRGGGVIRVRPDGTGLEIYSTGTRNILEVAISPQMDMFARDNTNDGGGWDVRLHHFTGMDDHGYPRLYKNFADECVQPLADYGGGSGCGAVYIDEPGFGKWNNAPFTADWGTGSLYRHAVSPTGSTFAETQRPESFIKMTRPTDADVDGNSRVYCASWRGATFNWEGPNVGYIVCVKPKAFSPLPLPNFATASDGELIQSMGSTSYRRRMESQRELMRRSNVAYRELLAHSKSVRDPARNLVERLQTSATDDECIESLSSSDPVILHTAIRCLAKRNAVNGCFIALDQRLDSSKPILRALAMMHEPKVVDGLLTRLAKETNAVRSGDILAALCRLHFHEGEWNGDSWGTRPDTRGPYYQPEPWSETPRIAAVLQNALKTASPSEAAELVQVMHRNRIQLTDSLERLLRLADDDDKLLGPAITQLAGTNEIPSSGIPLLFKAAQKKDISPTILFETVVSLVKLDAAEAPTALLAALTNLEQMKSAENEQNKARDAFINSPRLDTQVAAFELAAQVSTADGFWADVALVAIASKTKGSPELREHANKSIEAAWQSSARRVRLMKVAAKINNHLLDEKILQACKDSDPAVADVARSIVEQLKITSQTTDDTPKIATLSVDDATSKIVALHGDVGQGQQIFTRANCVACHTVRQDEAQKGPYLGSIAKTYKRPDLVTAILNPSKTIAQGFATNAILTSEGVVLTGFVTNELSDRVTLRDQQGKEFTVMKDDIEERKTSTTSVMPNELMNQYTTYELASLVDYLESLSTPEAAAVKE